MYFGFLINLLLFLQRFTLKPVSYNIRGVGFSPYQQYTGAASLWTSKPIPAAP